MDNKLLEMAKKLIQEKEPFVASIVVETLGSAPRKKGAWLLVRENGDSVGTVGGGILEAEVKKRAKRVFQDKIEYNHRFSLNNEITSGLDMRCGGDVEIAFRYIDEKNGTDFLKDFKGNDKAFIFGGGHVGKAVEELLRFVGFSTTVIDDREDFANKERFPKAESVCVIKDYKKAFGKIEVNENAYILILTRGHNGDFEVLKQSLAREAAYIGMIGSKRKVAETFKGLKAQGITEKQLERVFSPIGLNIKAETPEEIAISIVAEIVKIRGERNTII